MDTLKKLKNIGKKKKLNNRNLNKLRYEVLAEAKIYVSKNGWNHNLFKELSNTSKFKYAEIMTLFPEGYLSLIELYFKETNNLMTLQSKKINLIQLRVHERIRAIIILRLKIMLKEKKLVTRTYLHLLLPQNYNFALKLLYKVVDQIWYLAGDNSTDFNFYSKRIILASIYSSIIFHFINNSNVDDTIILLNRQLKGVSKIPKIKNRLKEISAVFPKFIKIFNNIQTIKQ